MRGTKRSEAEHCTGHQKAGECFLSVRLL